MPRGKVGSTKPKVNQGVGGAANTYGTTNKTMSSTKVISYVNSGSLEAFASSVTHQQREDVLQSTLLAQVLSDVKYKRDDDRWHKEYLGALRDVGWTVEEGEFQQYTPSGIFFRLDTAVGDVLRSISSENGKRATPTAHLFRIVKRLGLSDRRLQSFHESSFLDHAMVFQVTSATSDDSEGVSVSLASFIVQGTQQWMKRVSTMNRSVSSYLCAHHPTLLTTVSYAAQSVKLYESAYKPYRRYVAKTLKEIEALPFWEL